MNQLRAVIWALLILLPLSAFAAQKTVVEVDVEGMACPACSARLERALSKLDGVDAVRVSLQGKRARIVLAPGENPDVDKIKKIITDSGFTPGKATVRVQETQ